MLRDSPVLNARAARRPRRRCSPSTTTRASATGLDRLTQTTDILGPTLRFITPAQTVCNYATLLLRNVASLFAQGDGVGTWQRFTVFDPPDGPEQRGQPVAPAPANGGGDDRRNFLHVNPYPNTAAPGQTARVRGRQRAATSAASR